VADNHAALEQQLLDVAKTGLRAEVPSNRETDH
jgi:hypothetical protein